MRFQATINVPGYLPMADQEAFDTAREAWEFLRDVRNRDLDDVDYDEPEFDEDECLIELESMIDHPEVGTVYGRTVGYTGDHDLGVAYSVSIVHADYPHEPGRLYDCEACESECFCTGDPGHMPCAYCAIQHEYLESAFQD